MLYLGEAKINVHVGDTNNPSNESMVDVTKFYNPKEFEIYLVVGDVPYKLDYTAKNIENCFIRKDTENNSNYLILDGKLFQVLDARKGMAGLAQVGTSDKWTDITGIGTGGTYYNGMDYALGVCDGQLYSIVTTEATLINSEKGWYNLVGRIYQKENTSGVYSAFAMLNDSIYRCSFGKLVGGGTYTWIITPAIQGTAGIWKSICGTHLNHTSTSSTDRYPIQCTKDGMFYSPNSLGTFKNVTKFVGNTSTSRSSTVFYGYAITSLGELYRICNSGFDKFKTISTGWTDIAGFSSDKSHWGLGINNGKLYYLSSLTATQIGTDNKWTCVSGNMTDTRRAFAVGNKKLYSIKNKTTMVDIGLNNVVSVIANGSGATSPTFVICRA